MTNAQWEEIQAYVFERLKTTESFEIWPNDLSERLGLDRPFYYEMIDMAHQTHPEFEFHAHYKDDTKRLDPAEPIKFSRLPRESEQTV